MRYGKVFGGIATFGKRVVGVGNLGGGGVGSGVFNLGNFGGSRRSLRFVGKRFSNNSVYGGAVCGFRGGGNVVFVICAVVNKVNSPRPDDVTGLSSIVSGITISRSVPMYPVIVTSPSLNS